jgi:hypothetical protein
VSQSVSQPANQSSRQSFRQSVSQPVLGIEILRDSRSNFGCNQDSCDFVCRGAFSLSRGRVCYVVGYSPCLCSNIYTCTFLFLLSFLLLHFLFCILNTVCLCTHQTVSPGFLRQIMLIAHVLPKDITTV